MARLFNSLSSLAEGRQYLSQSPDVVETLLFLMYDEKHEDTPTRKNALGAVQKLSLRCVCVCGYCWSQLHLGYYRHVAV